MYGYLKRLLKTGAAYQVAEAVAKIIAPDAIASITEIHDVSANVLG